MKKIPLFIIEEHNEAFLIWNYACLNKLIRPFGNTLLHVDHHPDMEYGGYRNPIPRVGESINKIKEFTYGALGIADFIYPAIYQGIFNELIFIKNIVPTLSDEEEKCIYSVDGLGKNINIQNNNPLFRIKLKNEKYEEDSFGFFRYREGGLKDPIVVQPFVLDIDIDYFCADDSLATVDEKLLEITREAYEELNENPYHPFRILPRRLITHIKKEGKYYIKYEEHCEKGKAISETKIMKKINKFQEYLINLKKQPQLIVVCRSRYSGYTNNEVWEFIDKELLKVFTNIYEVEIKGVKDV